MRVSPPRVFPEASGAARPAAGTPGADAHRQTGFVLGREVDLVLRGLELEGAVAGASAGARYRTQVTASVLATWSRSWLSRLQALHAVQTGNYAASFPLVRAAADYQAAAVALLGADQAEWSAWIDGGGIASAHDLHATEFRLHAFRSAETLAANEALGAVYREATDLAMPHFGSTVLLGASESTPDRLLVTFGDRDFHLGLAELVLGWLLRLGIAAADMVTAAGSVLAAPDETLLTYTRDAGALLGRADRCGLETVERDGERRYLVANWRRTPGAAAKRVLL